MRIKIAEIVSSHGVRGLVKLKILCKNLDLFNNPVFMDKRRDKTLQITLKNKHKAHYLAEIQGVTDKDASDALRGISLYTDRENLPEPDENELYLVDLIGREARNEKGKILGEVIATHNFGASDLLEIKPPKSESFYLPFSPEFVKEVNQRYIVVEEITYL